MSYSIISLLSEEQRIGLLPLLPLPLAAAGGGGAESPGWEELPEWAQARTPRPAEDGPGEGPEDEEEEDDTYDVCHDCGAMHLPADNHHHGEPREARQRPPAADAEGEGEGEDEG